MLDPPYLRRLYIDQQWARAVDALPRLHARPLLFYVPVLLGGFFPWSALLPATLRATLRAGRRDEATVFCALWAAIVLVVFTLAEGKSGAYILPAFPPLALLTARFVGLLLSGVADATETALARAGLWIVVAVCAIAPVAAIVAGARSYDGALLPTSLWAALLLAPAAAVGWLLRQGRTRHAMLATAAGAAALLVVLFRVAVPDMMRVHSDEPIARALQAAAPDHAASPLVAYHVRSASLRFYLGRPVLLRENERQLRKLLDRHPLVFVVTSPRHVPELTAAGPFVPWWIGPRRVLYASQPPPSPAP
jgi:4-amino-4-deoxy-L-arabinose transferase-like glycosyltransferase